MVIQQIQQVGEAEQTEPKRRLFTLDEYEQMIEAGVFEEDEHLELIRGEIIQMPPIGFDHGSGVSNLIMETAGQVGRSARLWVQSPILLPDNSRPEPDFALLKLQDYSKGKPATAADTLLIVEVSDATLKYDRTVKAALYAQAGIPEYWIVNVQNNVIEVYTDPSAGAYQGMKQAKPGETLQLPAQLGEVQVSDIVGSRE